MSTLAEIEEAIDRLPEGQVDQLAAWLEERRRTDHKRPVASPREPDFLSRARKIWGDNPAGKTLSEIVSESRS